MRRKIIAGNWKMNKTVGEAVTFLNALKSSVVSRPNIDVVLCPPFTALYPMYANLGESTIQLAAQNIFWKKSGAYTGQISAPMLTDLGVTSVLIGHSETRGRFGVPEPDFPPDILLYFHETNETVNRKAHEALDHGLQPIICVGETLSERDAGNAGGVVIDQVRRALAGFDADEVTKIVFAYEPVWAIGTGRTCAPDEADQMCHIVRSAISELFHSAYIGDSVRIQYGGSAKPDNAKVLLSMPNIDGLLVGGASLIVADFIEIIRATDTVAA